MKPWDVEGKWSVSHFAWADEVRKDMPLLPKKVVIRDVTFREGDDQPGFYVAVADKIDLLRMSVELGIQEVDIGAPSMHKHHWDLAVAVRDSGIKVRKTARFFGNTNQDYHKDVDICLEAGATNFRIVLMNLSEEKALKQLSLLPAMVDYIRKAGSTVSWAISDTPRASMELIRKVYEGGAEAGAHKAGVNDTFGVATPGVMRYLAKEIRSMIPAGMPFKGHCHNTFGQATANSIACIEGGCDEVDCTINGFGDEAGNASLEEVAASLEAFYGIDTGLKMEKLYGYSQAAIQKGRQPIQPHKAVVGENAFLRPMAVWNGINMAKESWLLHEPLSPEWVGTKSSAIFGPEETLENAPIEFKIKEMGLPYTPADVVRLREAVEQLLQSEHTITVPKKYVTELEFEDLVRKLVAGPVAAK